MNCRKLCEILAADCMSCRDDMGDMSIENFCCTELMSDVLAYTEDGERTALMTALSNSQTLRTAEMVDIRVVVIIRGKKVEEELVRLAEESDIILLRTPLNMYDAIIRIDKYLDRE
ncbi:MAG: hypothetical protein ACOCWO_05660 [Candidatus Muiribacteriaceae bacterium]